MNITLENISHHFIDGKNTLNILDKFNIVIPENAITIILGPSGSGKTTLINIIGGLLKPVNGRVLFDGESYYDFGERAKDRFRAKNIGFVFQMFYLIPDLNVLANVMMSMHEVKMQKKQKMERAKMILDQVGLLDRAYSNPVDLSGGEQQRVAIARALANDSSVVIADEPTGNLDEDNSKTVVQMLCELKKQEKTVIIVTHNQEYKQFADNLIELKK